MFRDREFEGDYVSLDPSARHRSWHRRQIGSGVIAAQIPLGDIDIRLGRVMNTDSPILDRSVKDTILVVADTIGSAGAWRFLYRLHVHGNNPAAIVAGRLADSSLAQGAMLAAMPICCEPEVSSLNEFSDGDWLTVDGDSSRIIVGVRDSSPRGCEPR